MSDGKQSIRKGAEGFETFYSGLYGDRWASLRYALLRPVKQVARANSYADASWIRHKLKPDATVEIECERVQALAEREQFQIERDANGLSDFYVLDPASIYAASALEVRSGDDVLDLCAAPGGKSLILAQAIQDSGRLTCNEMSQARRSRLHAVLRQYLPQDLLQRVQVTGHDGSRWCLHEVEAYDRILLDAPCSGERHLLLPQNKSELNQWSPARSKNLAVRQYALLTSALQVLRPGGRLVYSTCSISNLENDAVIARLEKKRSGEFTILRKAFNLGQSTEFGWAILPDHGGYGPIYFSIIEKI